MDQNHLYYRYTKGHFAPAIRIELMSTVLETVVLPLHQAGCVALIQNYDIWTPKLTVSCSASELNQRLSRWLDLNQRALLSKSSEKSRTPLHLVIKQKTPRFLSPEVF